MGHIYLYYGTGGGKTTASLGIALRSVAHGHHVTIVQFLKHWKETGEYKAGQILGPLYEIRQFGRPGWMKTNMDSNHIILGGFEATLRCPSEEDKNLAKKALNYAKKVLRSDSPPEMVILDEVCLAAYLGIIETTEVLTLLNEVPKNTDVVLTGRYTPQQLIERADFVNEVREVKAPHTFVSHKGVQY